MQHFYFSSDKLWFKPCSLLLILSLILLHILISGCFSDNKIESTNQSGVAREHYLIAKEQFNSNELSAALTNVNKAIRLQRNYYYYYLRQRIYKNLMLWGNCAKDGQTLIQLEPGYYESYLLTADCNHQTGRYSEAINAYSWFLSEQGLKRADLFFKRGVSYSSLGEAERATSDWESACELDRRYCNLSNHLNKAPLYLTSLRFVTYANNEDMI